MSIDLAVAADGAMTKQRGFARSSLMLWRTCLGLALVMLLVAIAIIGPWVAPYGPAEFVGTTNLRTVEGTWLGSDYFGQDVWSRFLHGGRSVLFKFWKCLIHTALVPARPSALPASRQFLPK